MDDRLHYSACTLPPLSLSNTVLIQDQQANYNNAGRCTKSGVAMEVLPCSSYLFKVHGSQHVTQRNQLLLWKFMPFTAAILDTSPAPAPDYRPARALLQTLGALNLALPDAPEEKSPTPSGSRLQTHGGGPQEDTSQRSGLQHRPEAHGH